MFTGSIVALVTPMFEDGTIDWDALDRLVSWHLEQGSHGIVAAGTTGEAPTLSVAEHGKVIRRVVDQVAGRIPVIAGTGANATDEAIELTQMARDAGADGCLLVTPYYNKPTQTGLYQHFAAVAEAVAIPQLLYNVPARSGCDLLPQTVVKLAECHNIVGIKEATGDLLRAQLLLQQCPPEFIILSGDDATAAALILMGGKGNISVTANIVPGQMARLCSAALQAEISVVQQLQQQLLPLHEALFIESSPIPVKWALAQMGLMSSGIRLPLTPLTTESASQLGAVLNQCGVAMS